MAKAKKQTAGKKGETKPPEKSPDLVAELMLQRNERVNRARAEIVAICSKERVELVVAGFDIVRGQVAGRINIVAIDNV